MQPLRSIGAALLALCLLFLTYGCAHQRSGDTKLSNKVQTLESKVESLTKRLEDQTLKTRITGSQLFRSPLEQFFSSPEFWENTYDSGEADCANRCIAQIAAHRAVCATKPLNEQQQCYQEAADRGAECQRQCVRLNP
jgi:hypothetical protein